MYANLKVLSRAPGEGAPTETHMAWKVRVQRDGSTKVYTDLNDGGSNTCEEGPVVILPVGTLVQIDADF